MELTDTGFDFTVLSQFRARVVEHHLEEKVLDLLLERLTEQGLVGAGGKQRTDSTHIVSAVRDQTAWSWPGRACGRRWRR